MQWASAVHPEMEWVSGRLVERHPITALTIASSLESRSWAHLPTTSSWLLGPIDSSDSSSEEEDSERVGAMVGTLALHGLGERR